MRRGLEAGLGGAGGPGTRHEGDQRAGLVLRWRRGRGQAAAPRARAADRRSPPAWPRRPPPTVAAWSDCPGRRPRLRPVPPGRPGKGAAGRLAPSRRRCLRGDGSPRQMPSAARNEVRALAGRMVSPDRPACTASEECLGINPAAAAVGKHVPARSGPDQRAVAQRPAEAADKDLDVPRGIRRGIVRPQLRRRSASFGTSSRAAAPVAAAAAGHAAAEFPAARSLGRHRSTANRPRQPDPDRRAALRPAAGSTHPG